jgi:hypothetical protein
MRNFPLQVTITGGEGFSFALMILVFKTIGHGDEFKILSLVAFESKPISHVEEV